MTGLLKKVICCVALRPSALQRIKNTPHFSGLARLASEHFKQPLKNDINVLPNYFRNGKQGDKKCGEKTIFQELTP